MNFEKHGSRFVALMEQWRYFNELIDKIEGSYYSIPLAVLTIMLAGQTYINGVGGSTTLLNCLTLAVGTAVTTYLAYQMTRVAIIRGYLLRIENKLNGLQDECDFQWSTECALKYLGHNPLNHSMLYALALALLIVCIPAGMDVVSGCGENPIFIIPLVLCVIIFICDCWTLFYNYKILDIVHEGRTSWFFSW